MPVLARVAAALFGGYAVGVLSSVLAFDVVRAITDVPRVDAATAVTMASFAVHLAVAVWVFATASAIRAWLGVTVLAAVCGLGHLLLRQPSLAGA